MCASASNLSGRDDRRPQKSLIHPHALSLWFWAKAAFWVGCLGPVCALAVHWIGEHYLIGMDAQETLCLNGGARIYLIIRSDPETLWRDEIIAYRADHRMKPFFEEGTLMVKRLAAVPGDTVRVDSGGVSVNGRQVGSPGLAVAARLNRPESDFHRTVVVPPGYYFVIGESPRSFDSRYFGLIPRDHIVGRAIPLPTVTRIVESIGKWFVPNARAGDFMEAARAIRDRTLSVESGEPPLPPHNPHMDRMKREAERLAASLQHPDQEAVRQALETVAPDLTLDKQDIEAFSLRLRESIERAAPEQTARRYIVLVSTSLGETRLKELFSAYAGHPEVTFAFQGILDGQKIEDFALTVHRLISGMDPMPNVTIDPVVFEDHAVTQVPVVLAMEGDHLIARIDGLVNIEWLEDRLASKNRELPFIRRLGQVVAIAERNLKEVIIERLAKIDWQEKILRARERYWTHLTGQALPKALKNRRRLVDMRVRVPGDVLTPDGQVIARAGEVFNPLEKVAFRQALIIFDSEDQRQVQWAAKTASEVPRDGLVPVLITTRLPKGREEDALTSIQSSTGLPLYLLMEDVQSRFGIRRVPTLVRPYDDSHVEVSEVCVSCS